MGSAPARSADPRGVSRRPLRLRYEPAFWANYLAGTAKATKWGLVRSVLAAFNGGLAGNCAPPFRSVRYVEKVLAEWGHLKAQGQERDA
jgi:hypothetical protein